MDPEAAANETPTASFGRRAMHQAGNQASGTVIVLPSARSTISASSLVVTPRAIASLSSIPEVLMPFTHQQRIVFDNKSLNSSKLRACKTSASLQAHWIEPKLGLGFLPLHVNVWRLVSIGRIEEQPV